MQVDRGGHAVTAYPALVDEGASVGVRVVPTETEATRLHSALAQLTAESAQLEEEWLELSTELESA